jgi:hypothetical protein
MLVGDGVGRATGVLVGVGVGSGVAVGTTAGRAVGVAVDSTGGGVEVAVAEDRSTAVGSTRAVELEPAVTVKVVEALRATPITRPITLCLPTPVLVGIVMMLLPRPFGAMRIVLTIV